MYHLRHRALLQGGGSLEECCALCMQVWYGRRRRRYEKIPRISSCFLGRCYRFCLFHFTSL